MTTRPLPADDHVHSEFSWDAVGRTSMEEACREAVRLGIPAIAFTEHLDLAPWHVAHDSLEMFPRSGAEYLGEDSTFRAPPVDVEAYLEAIDRCRARFPELRIRTGIEFGEPHWFPAEMEALLAGGDFERVLGSLHTLRIDETPRVVDEWFHTERISGEAESASVRTYLAELTAMVEGDQPFEVVAHIDYLTRQVQRAGRVHDPRPFEDEYRQMLTVLARSGRVLEINTRLPLDPLVVRWWHAVGGGAVSFGSDAHTPGNVGHGFAEAAAVAEAAGFRAGDPFEFWRR